MTRQPLRTRARLRRLAKAEARVEECRRALANAQRGRKNHWLVRLQDAVRDALKAASAAA
jgi:hypothetical protein